MNSTFVDIDGGFRLMPCLNPYWEQRMLNLVDPEPLHAGEIMLGEIRGAPRNAGGGFGPGYSQLEPDDHDR
jgi:hypothetical protein